MLESRNSFREVAFNMSAPAQAAVSIIRDGRPVLGLFGALCIISSQAIAAPEGPAIAGIPIDFILFAATLLGVALFHQHTLRVALIGLASILAYKFLAVGFKDGPGIGGFISHLHHEWVILTNLFMLLMGFALLSRHFEKSRVPAVLPRILPHDWKGAFWLLVIVFVLSSFLDNIAAAMIGARWRTRCFAPRCTSGISPRSLPRRTGVVPAAWSAIRPPP